MARESVLARTMVELTDILVEHFDIVDVLDILVGRCIEVLDVAAAGILLGGPNGEMLVLASSEESVRVVELFELQAQEGPCLECLRRGQPVVTQNLAVSDARWPRFGPVAVDAGYLAVDAIPMRLRGQVIGALNLFRRTTGSLTPSDLAAAQALADIATIAILTQRQMVDAAIVRDQLAGALQSRIPIEQAKGMIAERAHVPLDQAFQLLRSYARDNNLRLPDAARNVIDESIDLLDDSAARRRPRPPVAGIHRPQVGDTRPSGTGT